MAFREVTMLEVKEVLRRWPAGESKKKIGRSVGVSRNTVRAYVKAGVRCGLVGQPVVTDEHLSAMNFFTASAHSFGTSIDTISRFSAMPRPPSTGN